MVEMIDHIGIAVRSLEERIPFYRDVLGLGEPEIETVADQKVRTAVFFVGADTDRGGRLELLEATDPESPIAKYIEKNGEGIHHIALRTPDLEGAIAGVLDGELRMIDEKPRGGAGGAEIAFVHPKSTGGVLLEFCRR
ncbi:MAG: methylmalonyl-CoA epimerase [Spirochaeta sp.]|jgi:methylmalonyl-CoA/ethylmalonyl-CoA epimerase|nr:methylmalonyl-CoA epimerase [Spirochaeta sp.]